MKDCVFLEGDCLEVMKPIPDKSIDMILCDLPYQRTQNNWDTIIPFEPMWKEVWRLLKDNGACLFFCDGLFMAKLMLSDKNWKYNRVWNKELPSGFLNANRMPLRVTEEIAVFYKKQPTYNPQKVKGKPNHSKGKPKAITKNNNYGDFDFVDNSKELGDMKHPTSLISIPKPHPSKTIHPTQKPVELLEELIKTYTNEREIVLDFTAGSMSTAIACLNTNRKCICVEKDKEIFEKGKERVLCYQETCLKE